MQAHAREQTQAGRTGKAAGCGDRVFRHSRAHREFLEKRRPQSVLRPVKQQLTVRLDADVIAWLRRQGKGYQTRLNQVLRKAMLEGVQEERLRVYEK